VCNSTEQNPPSRPPRQDREEEAEASVCNSTEQNPPLVLPPGPRGGTQTVEVPSGQSVCPAQSDVTRRDWCVRTDARSPYEAVASRDGLEGAVNVVGESNGRTTLRTPGDLASAANLPIAHARALFIYLKHRGVLNIEAFRRTNARSL
jgi:hypothetical protein